jgi:hypothetical protein
MWLACGLAVSLIIVQAIIFFRQAYAAGPEVGLTRQQMRVGVRSAAITSIGPSIVILSGMLSLLVSVGGPMAWMRLSLIGSVMFESMAAGIGTSAVGVTLGSDPMTGTAFAMAVWTMILGSIGWVIFSTLSANRMDQVQMKLVRGDAAMLTVISTAAIIGAFSALSSSHLIKLNKNSIACLAGAGIMLLLMNISEKKNIRWLKDWNLTFAILGGMLITLLF